MLVLDVKVYLLRHVGQSGLDGLYQIQQCFSVSHIVFALYSLPVIHLWHGVQLL